MGYNTDFRGEMTISPPLTPEVVTYMNTLLGSRRMKREVDAHYGIEGEFYVGDDSDGFGRKDPTVLDNNRPPRPQPSLWCGWVISENGTKLAWDGGEKFYEYTEWMRYIMETFLMPLGCLVNGEIEWVGEDAFDDRGKMVITNNDFLIITGRNMKQLLTPNNRYLTYWNAERQQLTK